MIVIPALLWVLFSQSAAAQAPAALERARQEVEQLRVRVEAGAEPRAALEQAEQILADAEDEMVLQRVLYGSLTLEELTEEQSREMVEAAERRLARQKQKLEKAKQLVEAGVSPRTSLTERLQELDLRRKTVDLAVSRANLFRELQAMARSEEALETAMEQSPGEAPKIAERYDGGGYFDITQLKNITLAFEREFGKPMPVSARGATAFHRSLGYDHRGRVDVALNPDQPEGKWLRRFLESVRIPYFAFRAFVPGKSTAPHIHIGLPSPRLRAAD